MKRRFTKLQDSRQVGDARKRFFVALHQRFVALAKKPPALEASALRGAVRFASGTSCVRLALCGGAPPKHACHCEPPNMIWMPCVSAGKNGVFCPPRLRQGGNSRFDFGHEFCKRAPWQNSSLHSKYQHAKLTASIEARVSPLCKRSAAMGGRKHAVTPVLARRG